MGISIGIFFFRLLALTIKVRLTPATHEIVLSNPRAHLLLLWHNRLALALIAFARVKNKLPLTGLVSASRDGAALALIMRSFAIQTARGSSSRRASEATRELLAALKDGRNIVITPDGPRGPIYSMKEGTATIAANHASGTLILGLSVSASWHFNSWDRFIMPKPFSTITVDIVKAATPITKDGLQTTLISINPQA